MRDSQAVAYADQRGFSVLTLEVFKARLDEALSNLGWPEVTLQWAGAWTRDLLKSLLAWIILSFFDRKQEEL